MTSPAIRKYLEKYAESEVALLPTELLAQQRYKNMLVIPVCDEPQDFLTRLIGQVKIDSSLLLILVLNCPDSDTGDEEQARVQTSTEALLEHLQTGADICWQADRGELTLARQPSSPRVDILLVDRCSGSRRIPPHQGVGLARKIGNDIALALFARGLVERPWLHNTDADVCLPHDYFSASLDASSSAALYCFEHHPATPELELATTLYELSLYYYVLGLKWAGSRYAHHSIGSIIAINPEHYAQVRGFPKRSGAEDFYLLNKLAKTGRIAEIKSAPVLISGRASSRVPFGTGPALTRISELENPLEEYTFYDPGVFAALGEWLKAVPLLWAHRDKIRNEGMKSVLASSLQQAGSRQPLQDTLIAGLESMNLQAAVEHALAQSQHEATFVRHIDTWFDALKTLQLIHYLRDNALPSAPFNASVAIAGFMGDAAGGNTAWSQQAHTLRKKIEGWVSAVRK